jgi:hypothetical protein
MSVVGQRVTLATILLISIALRFSGLDWGVRSLETFELDGQGVSVNSAGFNADADALHRAAESLSQKYYAEVDYAGQPYLFNSYGTAFLYLYRAAGFLGSLVVDFDPFVQAAYDANLTRLSGRWVSALAGVGLVWVTWLIGMRLMGFAGAVAAGLIAAVLPMSVQAAHLATVDGLLALWYGFALWASLRVLDRGEWQDYLVAGVCIGLAVATKINGLFLLLPLSLAHLLRQPGSPSLKGVWKAFVSPRIYGAIGVSLLTWIVLTPASILEWEAYFTPSFAGPYHVNFSLRKASEAASAHRGWLHLEGASTYLHHPFQIFPLGMGWTIQLALLAGITLAAVRRSPGILLVAVSFLVYYLLIARLPDKPIRFFVPLAAYVSILVSYPLVHFCRQRSLALVAVAILGIALEPAARSSALANVYGRPDSRVAAAQWIQDNIPYGGKLMLERGHNGLAPLVSRQHVSLLHADLEHELGNSRGDALASEGHFTALIEAEFLSQVDYFVMSEERLAVRKVRVAARDFYARLFKGELGFELQASFAARPTLFGITWEDENTDLNWTRYDHPTTHVFKRVTYTPSLYSEQPDLQVYQLRRSKDTQAVLRRAQKEKNFALFKRCMPAKWKERVGERVIAERFYSFLKDPSTLSGGSETISVIREGEIWRIKVE